MDDFKQWDDSALPSISVRVAGASPRLFDHWTAFSTLAKISSMLPTPSMVTRVPFFA